MPPPNDNEQTLETLGDQLVYFLKFYDEDLWNKFSKIKGPYRREALNWITGRIVLVLVDEFQNATNDLGD